MYKSLGMRIVRADKEPLISGKLNHQRKHLFLRVAVDPDITGKILSRRPLHLRGMAHILVTVIHPLKPFPDPAYHCLDRCHPQPWKTLKDPVIYHGSHSLAGVLNNTHSQIHEPGVTIAIPFTTGVVRVPDEVKADTQVE